jgi:hypothetical protein
MTVFSLLPYRNATLKSGFGITLIRETSINYTQLIAKKAPKVYVFFSKVFFEVSRKLILTSSNPAVAANNDTDSESRT